MNVIPNTHGVLPTGLCRRAAVIPEVRDPAPARQGIIGKSRNPAPHFFIRDFAGAVERGLRAGYQSRRVARAS